MTNWNIDENEAAAARAELDKMREHVEAEMSKGSGLDKIVDDIKNGKIGAFIDAETGEPVKASGIPDNVVKSIAEKLISESQKFSDGIPLSEAKGPAALSAENDMHDHRGPVSQAVSEALDAGLADEYFGGCDEDAEIPDSRAFIVMEMEPLDVGEDGKAARCAVSAMQAGNAVDLYKLAVEAVCLIREQVAASNLSEDIKTLAQLAAIDEQARERVNRASQSVQDRIRARGGRPPEQ